MLNCSQVLRVSAIALALWLVATAYIRFWPAAFTQPMMSALGFVTTLPMAWLSIWLIRKLGGLAPDQLLAGVALVGAIAMMIDGAALRFFPALYGDNDLLLRLGAAWLLWGYGVSLGVALIWAMRETSRASLADNSNR